jgi:integrase
MTAEKPTKTRSANGRSGIYLGSDGYWHRPGDYGSPLAGKPDRHHVRSRDKTIVTGKVKELERQRDDGVVVKPGR